jgi:YCII-related domain
MRSFILLYHGPKTAPGASHEGWPDWFQRAGEQLVDRGSPMAGGFVIHSDGTTSEVATGFNGFSIVRAADRTDVVELTRDHPFLAAGPEYSIEVFEVPSK